MPLTDAASGRGPFRLAVAMVAITVLTICWGAMTTSTGSGLAFLDWPLSDGAVMPVRSLHTLPGFFEHFHRLLGAAAGLCSLTLAIWVHRSRGAESGLARRLAWFGLGLIVVQGVVGGVGVLKGLPALTSVTHGTLAQLTLATFAVTAFALSGRYREIAPVAGVAPGTGRRLVLFALAIVVVQTVLGAIARHTNETHALWTHVGNATVVFVVGIVAAGAAAGRLGAAPGIAGLARLLLFLLIAQLVLGFVALVIRTGKDPANVDHLVRAGLISTHVLVGALLTVTLAVLAAHVFRATRTAPPVF